MVSSTLGSLRGPPTWAVTTGSGLRRAAAGGHHHPQRPSEAASAWRRYAGLSPVKPMRCVKELLKVPRVLNWLYTDIHRLSFG